MGIVSEAIEACRSANKAGRRSMVSARSGETEDVSISNLAVGQQCFRVRKALSSHLVG
ncbi:MAG: hypothetical protein GKR96_14075 [Gammaproteobacteria bacterium]|nr:hypothetical protein [Gammaproteobacteria bacterium]